MEPLLIIGGVVLALIVFALVGGLDILLSIVSIAIENWGCTLAIIAAAALGFLIYHAIVDFPLLVRWLTSPPGLITIALTGGGIYGLFYLRDRNTHRDEFTVINEAEKQKVGADGEISPTTGVEVRMRGTGKHVTETVYLEPGKYKLMHRIWVGNRVRISIVTNDSGEAVQAVRLDLHGSGDHPVTIPDYGRYAFHITPSQAVTRWSFTLLREEATT